MRDLTRFRRYATTIAASGGDHACITWIFRCLVSHGGGPEEGEGRHLALDSAFASSHHEGPAPGRAVQAVRAPMVLLDVVIPEGCGGDDSFAVHAPDGTLLDIQVPKGYAAGDVLTVEHCEAAVTVETVSVCIPDELVAGELFSVETSHGTFDVAVPPGCSGGMLIEVDLPTDPPPATGWS